MESDYLKQHYGRLETDELLKLRETELTGAAKTILEAELKSREGTEDAIESANRRQGSAQQSGSLDESSLAPLWRRFVAGALDYCGVIALLMAINFPMYALATKAFSDLVGYASILLLFVYIFFKDGMAGQSFGKRLLKIKVLERNSGEPCSLPRSLLRNAFVGLGFVDWIFALGKESRRLGDHVAGTYVVKA